MICSIPGLEVTFDQILYGNLVDHVSLTILHCYSEWLNSSPNCFLHQVNHHGSLHTPTSRPIIIWKLHILSLMFQRYAFFKKRHILRPPESLADTNYVHSSVSLPSKATYFWMRTILQQSCKNPLELKDLGRPPEVVIFTYNIGSNFTANSFNFVCIVFTVGNWFLILCGLKFSTVHLNVFKVFFSSRVM